MTTNKEPLVAIQDLPKLDNHGKALDLIDRWLDLKELPGAEFRKVLNDIKNMLTRKNDRESSRTNEEIAYLRHELFKSKEKEETEKDNLKQVILILENQLADHERKSNP